MPLLRQKFYSVATAASPSSRELIQVSSPTQIFHVAGLVREGEGEGVGEGAHMWMEMGGQLNDKPYKPASEWEEEMQRNYF